MRKFWISAALVATSALTIGNCVNAGDFISQKGPPAGYETGDPCDECDDGCRHCHLFGHHHGHRRGQYDGCGPGFNCGCNGSYKFPVPPLYTYHWPGMWSAQLMTDYHSPWRFPPLKPYADEVPPESLGVASSSLRRVKPASVAVEPARSAEPVSFSSHFERMYR
jgi:hypothetical protein